jgi:hypothetical protein
MLQKVLDLQVFKCSSYHIPVLKLSKPDSLEQEIRWSDFSRLAKFDHQHEMTVAIREMNTLGLLR